ncbi:MAG: hypothetical protein HY089_02585, partial [Ignavibacteriales bacterium]|nr:hypothetical protein [Ignavibacteriales bacterium]
MLLLVVALLSSLVIKQAEINHAFYAQAVLEEQQQAKQPPRLLYTLPAYEQVVIQKNIEYRRVNNQSLKFDFYRLPKGEKSGAIPVVIIMNGFGIADMKENPIQVE